MLDRPRVSNQAFSQRFHETILSHEASFRDHYSENHPSNLLGRPIVQQQCAICKKVRCLLQSHRAFARRLRDRGRYAPVRQVADEKIDPFAKHPIVMTPEYEELYARCWLRWNPDFNGPESHLFPHSRYSAIFRTAWHDEALHYGILALLATQVSKVRSGVIDQSALELQSKAIAAQSRAIRHEQLSDARVLTALCIMSNAFAANAKEDLTVHMALIEASLTQRGGLQYLGMDGIIADGLMLGDHTRAVIYNQKPHYQIQTPPLSLETAPAPSPVYVDLCLRGLVSQEVTTAASNYQILITLFDKAAKGRGTPSEATYFSYFANVVECQLANANARYHETNSIDECLVLGGLISNHTLLRNYGQLNPIVATLETRFWKCLTCLREKNCFSPYGLHDLELYLVCVGTITTVRRPSPFEQRSLKILAEMRKDGTCSVRTFHELCDVMEMYGWSESVCVKMYARIWSRSEDTATPTTPVHNVLRSLSHHLQP